MRERVRGQRDAFVTIDEFRGEPRTAVARELQRLVRRNELVAVRRGLYYRGRQQQWGMTRPSNEQIVTRIAGRKGVGPSVLLAANVLGLSTQIPAVETYAVAGPRPRDFATIRLAGRRGRLARRQHGLSAIEVAALEVLDAWTDVIDVPPHQAMSLLSSAITRGVIDARHLAAGAVDEPASARERLRVLLADAGRPELAASIRRARDTSTREAALAGLAKCSPSAGGVLREAASLATRR
ncbi:DUF6088 family protein [Cellulomonas triticagri]|uniref:DUF6088 family protein n=1 Tax=Cellulomonas triticagri TaxID=2483352 RepID=UPI0018F4F97B|nr:DUF6088 family protein [Cellulomonas triticagri]